MTAHCCNYHNEEFDMCCASRIRLLQQTGYATRAFVVAEGDTRDLNMCAICAGASHDVVGGQVDSTLQTIYSVVLRHCFLFAPFARAKERRHLLAATATSLMAKPLRSDWIRRKRLRQQRQQRRRRLQPVMQSECGIDVLCMTA